MEGPRFQKTSQGYHHGRYRVENRPRFLKNKKEESPSYHKPTKQGGQLEEGKDHYVKPSYVPCEQMKNLEAKPELALGGSRQDAVNKDQNRAATRRKDAKEYKTNFKDGERRNYPSKESSSRPLKTFHSGKPLRTKERSTGQHKSENELRPMKQNDVGAPQYSKPAVHVQPLQQLPESGSHILNESHGIPGKILEKDSKKERYGSDYLYLSCSREASAFDCS